MTRIYDVKQFDSACGEFIYKGRFNKAPEYYPRYETLVKQYCHLASSTPVKVLDVSGGQLSLLCHKLWNDQPCVADIGGAHLDYLQAQDLEVVKWNLCLDEQPLKG
jgi:hypothetical protein